MKMDEAKALYYKLVNSFGGRENEGIAQAWVDYLPRQDFNMAKQTVEYFIYQANTGFMPSISQFHYQLRQKQIQFSQAEVSKVDSVACKKCNGLTWEKSGEDAVIPCSQCRTVAYSRWEEGAYQPGAMLYQNELEGPTQAYAPAVRPQYAPQKPVSAERARQWTNHIKSKTGETFPEDIDIM